MKEPVCPLLPRSMEIITTADGSHTLFSEQFGDIYHSRHGALQESEYVFIRQGLHHLWQKQGHENKQPVRIFEVGFGTGLNALLTMLEAKKTLRPVEYTTIELYPVPIETIKALNYTEVLGYEFCYGTYHTLHLCRWNETHEVTSWFRFKKIQGSLLNYIRETELFDLIYFDAFSPTRQPEMWTDEVMKKLYDMLQPGGILVSYCSRSSFQYALRTAGFSIEKLAGPPGKREMVRAVKE